jgi:hypothetical protein
MPGRAAPPRDAALGGELSDFRGEGQTVGIRMPPLAGRGSMWHSRPEKLRELRVMAYTRLERATEDVYRVFGSYPHPSKLEIEEYRDPEKVRQGLASKPLRELGGEELGAYAGWAMTTVGDADDYRHFLPRILELGIHDSVWHGLEPWLVAGKLTYGEWRSWPIEEQRAIEEFFMAAWAVTVADDSIEPRWFLGLAFLGVDIELALQIWIDSASPDAIAKCVAVIDDDIAPAFLRLNGHLAWQMKLEQRERFRAWLLSAPVRTRMFDALQSMNEDWEHCYWLRRGFERLDRIAAMPPDQVAGMLRTELEQAIEDAYPVFACYPGPTVIRAVPGIDARRILRNLTSAPLRELADHRIRYYAAHAGRLVDSDADYRFFLPRVLEIAAASRDFGIDAPLIAEKLMKGRWRSWPETEQRALERVFFAAFEENLLFAEARHYWIVGIALAEMDMKRALGIWLAAPLPNAMIQCASTFSTEATSLDDEKFLANVFWAHVRPEIRAEFVSWLASAPVRQRLREALALVDAKDLKHRTLSEAVAALDRMAPLD